MSFLLGFGLVLGALAVSFREGIVLCPDCVSKTAGFWLKLGRIVEVTEFNGCFWFP